MAQTSLATGDAEVKKVWDELLFRDSVKNSYFARFMGSSSDSLVHVKSQLEKGKGDRIRFALRERLTGNGRTEGQALEGNEENLETNTHDLVLEQLRHAVRDAGSMTRQRAMYDVDQESAQALSDWMTEKIDEKCFAALETSPTKKFWGGNATSDATIDATDKFTPDLISKVKGYAVTGGNRTQTPLRPIMVDGKKTYIMLIHPEVAYDLKQNSDWQTAQQNANVRGNSNPVFSGALGIWDNVVIHEHENVGIVDTFGAGGNVHGATCSFMGAQSLVWGWGHRPKTVTKKFDYDDQCATAIGMIYAVNKPKFTFNGGSSTDYGSIGVDVACTDLTA